MGDPATSTWISSKSVYSQKSLSLKENCVLQKK